MNHVADCLERWYTCLRPLRMSCKVIYSALTCKLSLLHPQAVVLFIPFNLRNVCQLLSSGPTGAFAAHLLALALPCTLKEGQQGAN